MDDPTKQPAPPSMTDVVANDATARVAESTITTSSSAFPAAVGDLAATTLAPPPQNPFDAVTAAPETTGTQSVVSSLGIQQPAPPSLSVLPPEVVGEAVATSPINDTSPQLDSSPGYVTAANLVSSQPHSDTEQQQQQYVEGPTFMASPPPLIAFTQSTSALGSVEEQADVNGSVMHEFDVKASSSFDSDTNGDNANGDHLNGVSNGDYPDHYDKDLPHTPRTLPLGVPDDDEDPRATQHSLPSPEELKVTHSHRKSRMTISDTSVCFRYPKTFFVAIFAVVFVIALGLSVALTQETREERKEITFHGGDERLNHIVEFLVANGISDASDFMMTTSPQYQAADWIAHDDLLMLGIPKVKPTENDVSYAFVERYTMAVLYYATTGKSWRYDLSFLSDKPTCDWSQIFAPPVGQLGVLCNRSTSRIVGFSFISNNLEGSLPKELSQLTSLTYIESIGNAITSNIPSDLQKLTRLQTMVFAFNALTGSVPAWFNKLPKLEFLYLSNNLLTGSLPDTLAETSTLSVLALDDNNLKGSINKVWNLPNLEYLYLEDNEFTGSMPTSIESKQPLLINLDMSNNKLSGQLPDDLFRLVRLEILDLHRNMFVSEIPRDINADNDKLRFIALHENQLTGFIPPTIANLHQLTHLDLSSNLLTGRLPIEMDYLKKLSFLFLGGNRFTKGKIPSWVYDMTELRELSLKSSQLTGTISDIIGALSNLILLDLDNNKLTGSIPPDIGLLTNLEFLLLNRNELSQTLPSNLQNLESLRFLLLDNNHLLGDLTSTCSVQSLGTAYVDCGEIFCPDECCKCCNDGEKCHDYDEISSLDPVWEAGYERQFFDFSAGDGEIFSATDDDTIVSQGPEN